MTFSAIVVAAGSGSRAGGDKQWRELGGRPVVAWSVKTLLEAGARPVLVVAPPGAESRLERALEGLEGWSAVAGGATRADSVKAGLEVLDADDDRPVLVHDAARPFLGRDMIDALLLALDEGADGAIPALAVADSLRRGEADHMAEPVDREGLYRAQTPQAFRCSRLRQAYAAWAGSGPPTDEAVAVRAAGGRVRLVPGDPRLFKLTYPEDFALADRLLSRVTRTGFGYDVHRWGPGGPAWLCGIAVPGDRSLIGHSDADAGLHALTDAILGAIADGDIGDHFPPSDPRWKGASSDQFLTYAAQRVAARGGRIVNVDVTLICERPKIKPHRQAMRERIAALLSIPLDRVSVKATTTEGLGFTGRDEGLAAQAAASVEMPA